jgi:hypothetical protein
MKRDHAIKRRLRARGVDARPGQRLEVSKIGGGTDLVPVKDALFRLPGQARIAVGTLFLERHGGGGEAAGRLEEPG